MLVDVDEEAGFYTTIELPDSTASQQPRVAVVLPAGTWVRLDGPLQKPQLNGECGTLQLFDRANGRYEVQLGSARVMRIRPQNIRLSL